MKVREVILRATANKIRLQRAMEVYRHQRPADAALSFGVGASRGWTKGTSLTAQQLKTQRMLIEDTLNLRLQALEFCT